MTSSDEFRLQWLQRITEGRYSLVAITWLTFYEWILTANMEIELIHRTKWTSVKIMYLLCRYFPLLLWPIVSWTYVGRHNPEDCPQIMVPVQLLLAPLQLFPQIVMMTRTYAFAGRNKKILIGLSLGFVSLTGLDLWVFSSENDLPPESFYEMSGLTGCFPTYGTGLTGARIAYVMLAATLMDGVCLAVIVVQCYRTRSVKVSLARYFVFQGLYAFVFVLVVNVATATTFFTAYHLHTIIGLPVFLVFPNLMACRLYVTWAHTPLYLGDGYLYLYCVSSCQGAPATPQGSHHGFGDLTQKL
ncbi:hypothetical protein L208DRAFT_1388220 [Tricholoma matsutake]|nr:hypothetical protein L208DRAFT_1388220 [Tricholoma matsutake 945]